MYSGGIQLTVNGTNLDIVQNPRMNVTVEITRCNDVNETSSCDVTHANNRCFVVVVRHISVSVYFKSNKLFHYSILCMSSTQFIQEICLLQKRAAQTKAKHLSYRLFECTILSESLQQI